ncbi:MAG: peroxiredoxin [bacterium]
MTSVSAAEIVEGAQAPDFVLQDQSGTEQRLSDYRGQWVVLYFYPKDDTPGCTAEACHFRDDIIQLRDLKARLFGISLDDRDSHEAFASRHSLPFPLLSDNDGRVAKAYGALFSLGPIKFARRYTFIVDPQGRIAKVYRSVKPKRHSQQIITDLKALQTAAAL